MNESSISTPDPIDNSSLLLSNDSYELKEGLVDSKDFVLLPEKAYKVLDASYGGGPIIKRQVVSSGTSSSSLKYIELYPLKFNIFLSRSSSDDKISSSDKPARVMFFSLTSTVDDISARLAEDLQVPLILTAGTGAAPSTLLSKSKPSTTTTNFSHVRYWSNVVYTTYDTAVQEIPSGTDTVVTSASPTVQVETEPDTDSTEYHKSECLFGGYRWTTNKTDVVDGWTYLRALSPDLTVSVLFPNVKVVNLLVELSSNALPAPPLASSTSMSLYSKVSDPSSPVEYTPCWPREKHLNRWQERLAKGHILDAIDREGKWYEAKIVEMNVLTDGDVKVHYFGWSEKFDVVIKGAEKARMLQPLYSQTENWRDALLVGGEVEYRAKDSLSQGSKWHLSKVLSIDLQQRTIEVSYNMTSYHTYNEKKTAYIYGDELCKPGTHNLPKTHTSGTSTSTALTTITTSSTSLDTAGSSGSGSYRLGGSSYGGGGWYSSRSHTRGKPIVCGAVGLQNLGNTCFMASMLQCLSNTRVLTQIFLNDGYKADINVDNPLGRGGKIANVYAKLMRDMWSNQYSVVVPDEFKQVIGEFASQFAGYQQQDSQEFMCFLLDGLHEDLNRVRTKSFVTAIESKGRPDQTISREAWRRYILRNDSFLIDSFFGLSKSHVTCTGCGNESVTFEPFNSLSLPIPVKNVKVLDLTVFPLPLGSSPLKTSIEVSATATVKELKDLVVRVLSGHLKPIAIRPEVNNDRVESPPSTDDGVTVSLSDLDSPMEVDDALESGSSSGTSGTFVSRAESLGSGSGLDSRDYVLVTERDACPSEPGHGSIAGEMEMDGDANGDAEGDMDVSRVVEVSMTAAEAETEAVKPEESVHLYACVQSSYSSIRTEQYHRITRAFPDTASIRDIQKHEQLVFFQQHYQVEVKSTYSSYSYSDLYSRDTDKERNKLYSNSSVVATAVDIQIGFWKPNKYISTYSSSSFQLIAPVHRISILTSPSGSNTSNSYGSNHHDVPITQREDCEAAATTNADIHNFVREINRPMIPEDSQFAKTTAKPYDVYVLSSSQLNPTSVSSSTPLPIDSKPVRISSHECIVCIWKDDAYNKENHDDTVYDIVTVPGNISHGSDGTVLTLQDCLDKYMEREQLAEEQTLYCSKCKQHLAPLKKMDIWTAPEVLILQLKRFQYVPGHLFVHRDKITDLVQFPIEGLDMGPYIKGEGPHQGANASKTQATSPPPIYDLYAVSEHSGGLGGGHYTAVCKNFTDNKWYDFNDSHVSETTAAAAVTPRAYVLFYQRRGLALAQALGAPREVDTPSLDLGPNSAGSPKTCPWRWGGISLDEPTGLEDEKD